MPFNSLPKETATLLFKLQNISKLFVYKDNFHNHHGMVRIVTEVLRYGRPELIYMTDTEDEAFNYESYVENCNDCAIIRINLLDNIMFKDDPEATTQLFIEELENIDNAITVDTNMLDEEKNSSSVDIVIAPVAAAKARNSNRSQAA